MFGKRPFLFYILLFSMSLIMAQKEFDGNIYHEIEKKCDRINRDLSTFRKKAITWDEAEEGADGVAFYDGSQLKMFHVIWKGETGKKEIYYYFNKDKLIFIINRDYFYNRPIYYNKKIADQNHDNESYDANKTIIDEENYYFKNENLIRWIVNHKKNIPKKNFGNKRIQLIDEMKYLTKKLN